MSSTESKILIDLSKYWNPFASTTTIVYVFVIAVLIFKYLRQNERKAAIFVEKLQQNKLKLMPTPPVMPIIGHIYLMRDYEHNPWEGFNAIRRQFGDIVSLKMGIHQMILVSNFELMREVLITKGDIFADRPSFPRHDIVFGGNKEHSLALCNWSNTHKARRKFCKRGVVPNKLSARNQLLEQVVYQQILKFLNRFKNNSHDIAPPCEFNLTKRDILFLTGDIFMEFLCNERYMHQNEAYEVFNLDCDFIFWDINQCYLLDFLPYLTKFGFGFSYLKQLRHITNRCRYFIDDNIFNPRRAKHIAGYEQSRSQLEADENDDYLDSIIKEELSNVTTMSLDDYKVGFADLLAGHGAVANILMRLLGHLSLNKNAQEIICEEAKRVEKLDLEHRTHLPVAEAALQEALRLASSPIVPHVAREDTSLGEYFVPKKSAILFNCYNVNLSEELWENPREYDPTRFLALHETIIGQKSYKLNVPKYFMPFSVGLRQCLGYRMVEAISIATISQICGNFIIEANDDDLVRRLLEPRGSIALNPLEKCFELKLSLR